MVIFPHVVAGCRVPVHGPGWPSGSRACWSRCAGQAGQRGADIPEPAADPAAGQAPRGGAFSGQGQAGDERPREPEPAALRPRPEISLTTKGIGLTRLAGPLAAAGLDRVNVPPDTLSASTFARLTRPDRLADVLAGLDGAATARLVPVKVKVNAVLMRGVNDANAVPLLRFCPEHGHRLWFIEQMPLDDGPLTPKAASRRLDPYA